MNLVNFRDLGYMEKIKPKRLLRAAAPVQLNPEAIALLEDHNLKHIVDFRSVKETEESPNDEFAGVSYINYDVMASHETNMASEEEWLRNLTPESADKNMEGLYREFITASSSLEGYSQFIKQCANNKEGAILFHCVAGKDRTGFGAALLLKILGLSDEDIFLDFMKTMEARKEANAAIIEHYRTSRGLTESQVIALEILYGVKQSYLEVAFDTITAEYGSFDAYVKDGLGITEEELSNLRAIYLKGLIPC